MSTEIRIASFPLAFETESIIGAALEVHKNLGNGFLEVVYKDALEYEFYLSNLSYQREKEYPVFYKEVILKHKFYADFILLNTVVVEIKAKDEIADEDLAQTINYLKCSNFKVGLILNFGRNKLEIKRVVL